LIAVSPDTIPHGAAPHPGRGFGMIALLLGKSGSADSSTRNLLDKPSVAQSLDGSAV
jgi:hypothetical protein